MPRKSPSIGRNLTEFLLMLSYDPNLRAAYNAKPKETAEAWLPKLSPRALKALATRDAVAVREAFSTQSGIILREARKARPKSRVHKKAGSAARTQ